MRKGLKAAGSVLWIIGLGMTLVGLNIADETMRKWISVIGNIVFLIGLFLVGIVWFQSRRNGEQEQESGLPSEPEPGAGSRKESA